MVNFICNDCGESLKKNKVAVHQRSRMCGYNLSCMDCQGAFDGENYTMHTSCISEAEKYAGKSSEPSESSSKKKARRKKDDPQQRWVETIVTAQKKQIQSGGSTGAANVPKGTLSPSACYLLQSINVSDSSPLPVPRKRAKFFNFLKNSLGGPALKHATASALDELWNHLHAEPSSANGNGVHNNAEQQVPRDVQMKRDGEEKGNYNLGEIDNSKKQRSEKRKKSDLKGPDEEAHPSEAVRDRKEDDRSEDLDKKPKKIKRKQKNGNDKENAKEDASSSEAILQQGKSQGEGAKTQTMKKWKEELKKLLEEKQKPMRVAKLAKKLSGKCDMEITEDMVCKHAFKHSKKFKVNGKDSNQKIKAI